MVDLLAKIDLKPDQIKYVASDHQADHTGPGAVFPKETLRIGSREGTRSRAEDG